MKQSIKITEASMAAMRQYYIDNCKACIDEAVSGEVHVNDLQKYIEWNESRMVDIAAGKSDHTFTFQQHAVYIQTGVCHALLA